MRDTGKGFENYKGLSQHGSILMRRKAAYYNTYSVVAQSHTLAMG